MNDERLNEIQDNSVGPLGWLIRFCLENKLVVGLFVILVVCMGIYVAPFDWELRELPRNPVPFVRKEIHLLPGGGFCAEYDSLQHPILQQPWQWRLPS